MGLLDRILGLDKLKEEVQTLKERIENMPTKEEVKAAIAAALAKVKADIAAAIAKEKAEVLAKLQALQDQINAGQPITSADLDEIVTSVSGVGTSAVADIDKISDGEPGPGPQADGGGGDPPPEGDPPGGGN